jgi:hypothetical protein
MRPPNQWRISTPSVRSGATVRPKRRLG